MVILPISFQLSLVQVVLLLDAVVVVKEPVMVVANHHVMVHAIITIVVEVELLYLDQELL